MMLGRAIAHLQQEDGWQAAVLLSAILGSDHLTERGRSSMYWLAAEAWDLAREPERRRDALGGFLVSVELLPEDDELHARANEVRAAFLAEKVRRHPLLGKTPETPIVIDDSHDVDAVVARLGCGRNGQAAWVAGQAPDSPGSERGLGVERGPNEGAESGLELEARTLTCSENGAQLTLWFELPR